MRAIHRTPRAGAGFVTAPGPRNLITDVAGIAVGNAGDEALMSGVTVVLPDEAAVAAVDTRGGGPATRETDALDPACLVDAVHGLVLSGGSVFGLDAASGVTHWLDARGRGFRFGEQLHVSPVVPAACLFDFLNGGDKDWGDEPPYRALGLAACDAAAADFALGNAGAGLGAIAGRYKGGLGSASVVAGGVTVGALMAVNAFGSPVVPGTDVALGRALRAGRRTGASGPRCACPCPQRAIRWRPTASSTCSRTAASPAATPPSAWSPPMRS